jgi:hypothetical protein
MSSVCSWDRLHLNTFDGIVAGICILVLRCSGAIPPGCDFVPCEVVCRNGCAFSVCTVVRWFEGVCRGCDGSVTGNPL